MRLKHLTKYYIMKRALSRDAQEGGRYEGFAEEAAAIMANIYDKEITIAAGSTAMSAAAGGIIRKQIKIMLIDAPHTVAYNAETRQETYTLQLSDREVELEVGDGVCVYTTPEQGPDYRIGEITNPGHLKCKLERIG